MRGHICLLIAFCSLSTIVSWSTPKPAQKFTRIMSTATGAFKTALFAGPDDAVPAAVLNEQDQKGMTALMHAANAGQVEFVIDLMNKGAAVDIQDERGMTALMHAAIADRVDVAKALIDNGAEIDLQDSEGLTALTWAVLMSCVEVAKTLRDIRGAISKENKELEGLFQIGLNGVEPRKF